jgi:hypothetical protein
VSAPLAPRDERALRASLAGMDRRGFLRLAAGAAAAGLLPAGCAPGAGPPRGARLAVLSPRTWAVLDAAARRFVGPRGEALIAAGVLDPASLADGWLARLGHVGATFDAALWTVELAPWPLVPKLRPFTALAPAAQDDVLRGLRDARFALARQLFAALKTFSLLAFYAHPASHAAIAYPPPFGAGPVAIADAMLPPGV